MPRRRWIEGVVAGLALAAFLVIPASGTSLRDVPASYPYYGAISDLSSRGIINGYADGSFGPGNLVNRQQFAKMIVLTVGYPVSESDVCPFSDVQKSGPRALYPDNYVAVCAANGITTGKSATTFAPKANITRYQVTSMVVRATDDLRPGLLRTPPARWTSIAGWEADPTYGAAAARAEYNGLLAGLDLTALSPGGNMTRGEVAQVLHNLLGKLATTTTTVAPTTTTVAPTTTTVLTQAVIVFDGDSLTSAKTYPTETVLRLKDVLAVTAFNAGVGGQDTADMLDRGAEYVDVHYDGTKPYNICVAWETVNDISGMKMTAAQSLANMKAYCLARRAAGFRVIVCTGLPSVHVDYEEQRQIYNATLRSTYTDFADGIADLAADPRIGDSGDEHNATYYVDGTHMTTAGYNLVGDIVATAILGQL